MNRVCSIFSQVLKLFSRGDFEKAVNEHQAERHARGFTSWGSGSVCFFRLLTSRGLLSRYWKQHA